MAGKKGLVFVPVNDVDSVSNIAYFIHGGIGDALLAYPAIKKLSAKFTSATITIFVPKNKYDLLSVMFSQFRVRPIVLQPFKIVGSLFVKKDFDMAFTNTVAVFSAYIEIASSTFGLYSFGFRYNEENTKQKLYQKTLVFSETIHAAKQNMQLVCDVCMERISEKELFIANDSKNLPNTQGYVIIHPGSEKGYENKRWSAKRYCEIAERILKKGKRVHVLLGPSEVELKPIFEKIKNLVLICDMSHENVEKIFLSASLFIGNDSGPAHIAFFYGVPQIILFGPVDPQTSSPIGAGTHVIYHNIKCAPCHFKNETCSDNVCMKYITVDEVWQKAIPLL